MAKKKGTEVSVAEFLATLKFLRGFAAQKSDRAAQTAAYFHGPTVCVNGGVTGARMSLPFDLGTFGAPVERLLSALSAVDAQGVKVAEVEVTDANFSWRGGSARGRVALVADPIDDFPRAPESALVVVDDVFFLALEKASKYVAKSEQWPMLRGAYWSRAGSMMASDGDRMIAARAPAGLDVTVPDHLLRALGRYSFASAQRAENEVWFSSDECSVFGRLYQAEFPHQRFEAIFSGLSDRAQRGELTRFVVDPKQPVGALLKGVIAAAEAPLYGARVRVGKKSVELWCESEAGEARASLAADVAGPEVQFFVNAQYLAEAIAHGAPIYKAETSLYVADDARVLQSAMMLFAE